MHVLVTGASGFLGKSMVKQLVANGAVVCAIGRNVDSLKALQNECAEFKGQVIIQPGSISSINTIESAIDKIYKATGELNGWVNNAYQAIPISGPLSASEQELDHYMDALKFTILATQCVANFMLKNSSTPVRSNSILNIASMYGHIAPRLDIYENNLHLQNPPGYGVLILYLPSVRYF
jgi:short-subunit dehydrogenase